MKKIIMFLGRSAKKTSLVKHGSEKIQSLLVPGASWESPEVPLDQSQSSLVLNFSGPFQ